MKQNPAKGKQNDDDSIETLLLPSMKSDLRVEKAFLGLEPNFNLLLLVEKGDYFSAVISIVKRFLAKPGAIVIFVATARPYEKIKVELLREKIVAGTKYRFLKCEKCKHEVARAEI